MKERYIWFCLLLAVGLVVPVSAFGSLAEGNDLFHKTCAACHTIGKGRLVGPDLAGIGSRRSSAWIRSFVRSSQSMVAQGEADAVALFDVYKIPMPDHAYDDSAIDSIVEYIDQTAALEANSATVAPATPARVATAKDIELGGALFQGKIRFANSGPSCNSCHHVQNDAVIGGGILAKELTTVFSRMGAPGVKAILGSPPFAVMEQAFTGRPLQEEEIFAIVSFLESTDKQQAYQQPRDYGFKLFYTGAGGALLLFGVFGLLWSGRKKGSVYQAIFDRQTRTI